MSGQLKEWKNSENGDESAYAEVSGQPESTTPIDFSGELPEDVAELSAAETAPLFEAEAADAGKNPAGAGMAEKDFLCAFITGTAESLKTEICSFIEKSMQQKQDDNSDGSADEQKKSTVANAGTEALLDKMHDELQKWRSNFYDNSLLNPIYLGLLEAYDLTVNANRGGDPAEQLQELPEHIEGIFQNLGFDVIKPETGERVTVGDRSLRIIKTAATSDPDLDKTIAAVHKNGFFRILEKNGIEERRLLRPAWVTMYQYAAGDSSGNNA